MSVSMRANPADAQWRGRLATFGALASIVCARSAVVMTFGLGLGFAVFNAFQGIEDSDRTGVNGLIGLSMILLAAASVAFSVHLARRSDPLPVNWFVPVTLLVALVIRLTYYVSIDPAWISDFGRYWTTASDLAGATDYHIANIYDQRAMPYMVPIAEVFGDSRENLKLANIILISLVQLLGYDVLRRCHGHRAAQCFTILWIAAPEPLYSTLVPSHDLVAMGQLAVALWLTTLAIAPKAGVDRNPGRYLFYAVAIGFMLAMLQLQRGIGPIVLASLFVIGIVGTLVKSRFPLLIQGDSGQPGRLLLLAFVSLPVYVACMAGTERANLSVQQEVATTVMLRYTTAHATSLSDGSYRWMRAFDDTFTHAYTEDPVRYEDLRTSLVLSDLADSPLLRAGNAMQRLGGLYDLGGSMVFYAADVADESPRVVHGMRLYNAGFSAFLALLSLYGLIRLLTRPGIHLITGVILVIVVSITLGLVLLAENQPRYLYIVWFVAAALAAAGIAGPADDAGIPGRGLVLDMGAAGVMLVQAFLAFALFCSAAWIILVANYNTASGRVLSNWSLSVHQPSAPPPDQDWASMLRNPESDVLQAPNRRRPVGPKRFGAFSLTLQLPHAPAIDDRVEARHEVCRSGEERDDLAFFVYTPYKQLERRGAFELQVSVNGHPAWQMPLPYAAEPVPVEIQDLVPANSCTELVFTLRSNINNRRASWRRASRVEIYFPRLVDASR